MLLSEMVLIYSENHMKPTDTLCRQGRELLIDEAGGAYPYH
jgi:hypothetical protein